MTPKQFLDSLEPDRKEVLSRLRELILKHDKNVEEVVSGMMGKPSLIYVTKEDRLMKYSLSSAKNHMSFASMVMYGSSTRFGGSGLREAYQKLLPKAKFQQGCINFKSADQFPLDVAKSFIVDMAAEEYPPPEYKDRMIANEKKRLEAVKKRGK
jgi:hypothetical protein